MLIRKFSIGFFGILISGCIPLTGVDYKAFALELVPPGTELVQAISILENKSYKCSTKETKYVKPKSKDLLIYCYRSQPGFLYACAQSIVLDIDETTWQVNSNEPRSDCTGL